MAKTTTHADYTATALTLTTAAQPNITTLGTLTTLTVDDITIDGSTISDGGDFTLDVGGDIILDADGADIRLKDGGTQFGVLYHSSGDFVIQSDISDEDIIFKGNDGGSAITALTLDMSEAGAATFNGKITADAGIDIDNFNIDGTTIALSSGTMVLDSAGQINIDSGNAEIHFLSAGTTFGKTYVSSGDFYFNNPTQDKDIVFAGDDGGSSVTALTLDMSEAGDATFNRRVGIGAAPTYYHDVKVPSGQAGSSQIVQRIWSENQGWAAEALTEYYTDLTSTSYPRAQIGFYRGDTSNNDSSGFIVKTGTSSSGMSTRFKVTATGMVEMPEQPAFHATLSSSQTITSTNTTIAFNSETFDRKSNHSNGVFTAPHAGVYLFGTNFLVYPFSAGVINIGFFKGSSNYAPIVQQGGNGDLHQSITRTCLIECAKDDEITVRISGTGITSGAAVYGSQAEWWGYLVG